MALSPGVVPQYRIALPHYWDDLANSNPKKAEEMSSFSSFLRDKNRLVVGEPQGQQEARKKVLKQKHPSCNDYQVELLLYMDEVEQKRIAERERDHLRTKIAERKEHQTNVVIRKAEPPKLVDERGNKIHVTGQVQQWLSMNDPATLQKWKSALVAARDSERFERMNQAEDPYKERSKQLAKIEAKEKTAEERKAAHDAGRKATMGDHAKAVDRVLRTGRNKHASDYATTLKNANTHSEKINNVQQQREYALSARSEKLRQTGDEKGEQARQKVQAIEEENSARRRRLERDLVSATRERRVASPKPEAESIDTVLKNFQQRKKERDEKQRLEEEERAKLQEEKRLEHRQKAKARLEEERAAEKQRLQQAQSRRDLVFSQSMQKANKRIEDGNKLQKTIATDLSKHTTNRNTLLDTISQERAEVSRVNAENYARHRQTTLSEEERKRRRLEREALEKSRRSPVHSLPRDNSATHSQRDDAAEDENGAQDESDDEGRRTVTTAEHRRRKSPPPERGPYLKYELEEQRRVAAEQLAKKTEERAEHARRLAQDAANQKKALAQAESRKVAQGYERSIAKMGEDRSKLLNDIKLRQERHESRLEAKRVEKEARMAAAKEEAVSDNDDEDQAPILRPRPPPKRTEEQPRLFASDLPNEFEEKKRRLHEAKIAEVRAKEEARLRAAQERNRAKADAERKHRQSLERDVEDRLEVANDNRQLQEEKKAQERDRLLAFQRAHEKQQALKDSTMGKDLDTKLSLLKAKAESHEQAREAHYMEESQRVAAKREERFAKLHVPELLHEERAAAKSAKFQNRFHVEKRGSPSNSTY